METLSRCYQSCGSEHWLKRPPFLRQAEDQWPENGFEDVSPDDLELKKTIYSTGLQPPSPVEELINRSYDWVQTLRRVAWLLRYLDWLRWRAEKNAGRNAEVKYVERKIKNEDLERAKRRIAAVVQARSFPKRARDLKDGKSVKTSIKIIKKTFHELACVHTSPLPQEKSGEETSVNRRR